MAKPKGNGKGQDCRGSTPAHKEQTRKTDDEEIFKHLVTVVSTHEMKMTLGSISNGTKIQLNWKRALLACKKLELIPSTA